MTPTHVEDTKSSNSTSNVTIASTSAATATHAEDTSSYNSTSNVTAASASHMTATHAEDTSSSRNSNIATASTNIMTANHGEDVNLLTHGGQTQQTGDMTKHCTNKVLKQKIVTELFKPVSQEDHNNANDLNALQVKINRLDHEKRLLAQEVDRLKQQIITMKSQNKNVDSQPENAKKKSKKSKRKKQTPSTPHTQQQEPPSSKKQQQQQQKTPREEQQQQHSNEKQQDCQTEKKEKQTQEQPQAQEQTREKPIKSKAKVMIVRDSIIRNLKGWMISRTKTVKIHSFSGANTKEMEYFLKPLLERKPSHIILHVGTNDLAQGSSCNEVAEKIINIGRNIVNKGTAFTISMLTTRSDGLNPMVRKVNNILEKLIKSETNIDIIDNDNIRSEYHLNSSGLHLNRKGDAALARNYISYLKSSPNL